MQFVFAQGVQERAHDLLVKMLFQGSIPGKGRTVGSHSAGVWTFVAVLQPFVIARCAQQLIALTIHQEVERALPSLQKFLDQNLRAGGAEALG